MEDELMADGAAGDSAAINHQHSDHKLLYVGACEL